ncbi:hypothetical protein [Undibacterium sp. Ji22W]|uniref:hypothetical protein n=1 Tax=Undibacterium sp. Ji22W TaxID=3413038 RepID=UPI003BF14CF9
MVDPIEIYSVKDLLAIVEATPTIPRRARYLRACTDLLVVFFRLGFTGLAWNSVDQHIRALIYGGIRMKD